jgi:hypothetical protein
MGRKKLINKKINSGITIHPELARLLKELSKKEKISISKMIEDVITEHLKNKKILND